MSGKHFCLLKKAMKVRFFCHPQKDTEEDLKRCKLDEAYYQFAKKIGKKIGIKGKI
jgi:hypothetical protein